jgi:hypothetical protein
MYYAYVVNIADVSAAHIAFMFTDKVTSIHEYSYTRWRSWMRHYAASRKVMGSIPEQATGLFYCSNPSSRTMALE